MAREATNACILFTFLHLLSLCLSVEHSGQNSTLSCLFCFNGDNQCLTLWNISNIPVQTCKLDEPFCKVRRLNLDGQLKTFDRYCASQCEPGCHQAARYTECVSCCNHRSLCNVDNCAAHLLGVTVLTVHALLIARL